MNIFVINGSPKGAKSNTYRLARAFVEGLGRAREDVTVREFFVAEKSVKPCLGCFSCWNRTPGECCIRDDMAEVLSDLLWADVTIWSFPLYYFGVPGGLKNLIDRQLPFNLPFMEEKAGQVGRGGHPARYDMSGKRTVVISTCGFYTAEGNYDGVTSLFDHLCGRGNYTTIFCGQGELFRVPELSARTDDYLVHVQKAGEEYGVDGGISSETRERLSALLLPRETFEACADASWGIERGDGGGEKTTETLSFTKQMAALYNKNSYPGEDLVLEMRYTDVNETYQILLGKDGSRVVTDGSLTPTTVVETPVAVWRSIAAGEIRGDEAMMKGLYRVTGDFTFMLKWDEYFGVGDVKPEGAEKPAAPAQRGTNMTILLIPWIALWTAAAIDPEIGSLVSLFACAAIPLVFYKNKKTFYDLLSNAFVIGFSSAILFGASEKLVLPLSYFTFGAMWVVSCLGRLVPLTAHYSANDYGGDGAMKNPLFVKTNRILTLLWGVLYVITSVFTLFLMRSPVHAFAGLINSVVPIFMGIFTAWFQKWYPARVAWGKGQKPG
ncbi:MAG: NAD(P)H-dependent oxidoreductase [Bacteroides sp.]|nr:NAD(P)H-dependent oxidoreductase [Roseburia sp.]MCM1463545.1 NAD(P)H-dependent oxidoreductase [Bacteroides sp.]